MRSSSEAEAEAIGESLAIFRQHLRRGVQTVPHVVAIEHETPHAALMQQPIDLVGHRALPAPRQAGEPNHAAFVPIQPLAVLARDAVGVPDDLGLILVHR